jgi:WD40 repeat protein
VLEETGILISCSYDKTIITWKYQAKAIVEIIEKNEELRCMDYIASSKTLFVGTNQKNILTVKIDKLMDPNIQYITDFSKEGFDLAEELSVYGYQPGSNIQNANN